MKYLLGPMLLLCNTGLHAEIYKCTDVQGDTQYTDEPCGNDATVFVPRSAPAPAGDAAARRDKLQRLLRAYDVEHAQQQRMAAEAHAARAEREANCNSARDRWLNVTQARALYRLDENGNQVAFSYAERAAAEEQALAAVQHWCGRE